MAWPLQDVELVHYIALADYEALEAGELPMREADTVEVIKMGSEGWWYVRNTASGQAGWVPATFLDSAKRHSTHSNLSSTGSLPGKVIILVCGRTWLWHLLWHLLGTCWALVYFETRN